MEKEVLYRITLTESQLRLLGEVSEKFARIIVGQLYHGMGEEMEVAYEMHHNTPIYDSEDDDREELDRLLNGIKKLCFKQEPNSSYGVGYNEKSDTLLDIHEVIRHQLWSDSKDKPKFINGSYPAHHWNEDVPLIEVNKIK